MPKKFSNADYCQIYRIPESTLRGLREKGADPSDARTVFAALRKTTRKPDTWREFFSGGDGEEDSKEFWQKREIQEKVRKLELANALVEGEQFLREDVDAANMQLGTAFKLALMEAQSQLPPQLAGLDEAGVERVLTAEFRRILGNMSDLSSALWNKIREKYEKGESESDPGSGDGSNEAEPGPKRKRVVRGKRSAGARSRAEH